MDIQRILGVSEIQEALLVIPHCVCVVALWGIDCVYGEQLCGTFHLCAFLMRSTFSILVLPILWHDVSSFRGASKQALPRLWKKGVVDP
jgi:hypothetical protein